MRVGLIWAQAANRVIGSNGALPWTLPEDLARFREVTHGATVLMGRRTWDSLPVRYRPLPGRRNVVVTRQAEFSSPGAEVVHDVQSGLVGEQVWVIGGAAIFAAALPYAQRLVVTEIDRSFEGDVYGPPFGSEWQPIAEEDPAQWRESCTGLRYRFLDYARDSESR